MNFTRQTLWHYGDNRLKICKKSKTVSSLGEINLYGIPEHEESKLIYPNKVGAQSPFFWKFLKNKNKKGSERYRLEVICMAKM